MDFIPLPNFVLDNVPIWFAQLEATFSLNGIISQEDKYHYILIHIPVKYSTIMEDVILGPPRDDPYEFFKDEFIKRMSVYLMKQEEMGNRKPSEYLYKLKKMADKRVPKEYILNVWLNNLPLKVREIVGIDTSGNADNLCEMADKVMALMQAEPRPTNGDLSEDKFRTIMARMDELTKQVRITQLMFDAETYGWQLGQPCSVPARFSHEKPS